MILSGKTPSPAVTPSTVPKNQENVPSTPASVPALNVIDVQIDEEAFRMVESVETTVEKVSESALIYFEDDNEIPSKFKIPTKLKNNFILRKGILIVCVLFRV